MTRYHIIILLITAASAVLALKLTSPPATRTEAVNDHGTLQSSKTDSKQIRPSHQQSPSRSRPDHSPRQSQSKFNKDEFTAEVMRLAALPSGGNMDPDRAARMFILENHGSITSAKATDLKGIYTELEQAGPSTVSDIVRSALIMEIIKTDPAWAINRLCRNPHHPEKAPDMEWLLQALGKNGALGNPNWNPDYTAALGSWLDNAVAEGRLKEHPAQVATMRFDLSLSRGDLDGAVRHLENVPDQQLGQRLDDLAATSQGAAQGRHLLEQIAPLSGGESLRKFSSSLATHAGFANAAAALKAAKLSPEDHDMAAAGIAAGEISQQTASRAEWLVNSLQSESPKAVTRFTEAWAQASHKDAAAWISSLPAGKVRDAAAAGYAPLAASMDGQSAAKWALIISEPELREATFEQVMRTWRKNEPEVAAAYLERIKKD